MPINSGDNSFGKSFGDKKLKSPNVHEKEDEYSAKMVMPITTFKFVMGFLSVLSGVAYYLFKIKNILNLSSKIPIYAYLIAPGIFILSLLLLHPVLVDVWVPHVANSRIGSSYCKIGLRGITIDYDVLNSKKDINKFVEEITDKSEDWNYFIKKISPTTMKIKLKVRPKVKIPTKATLEGEYADNEMWNYIPLGICLTDNSILGSVNWMLNDNNKVKGEHKETIPSTSFLVAGGTGSGKSVLENNIIRHVNKFNENFQAMLVDVKRVEFGGLSNLEAIKAVALDIKEAEACLRASREIMYSRFKFMEKAGVNNVYKLLNYKCSYFYVENVISGVRKLYQFDEILYCEIDGEVEITTIDQIAQKASNGSNIKVYFSGQKEKSLSVSTDKEICKKDSSGETLYIREITPGDFYTLNKKIFYKNEIISTNNGNLTAEKIFDLVSSGKKMSTSSGENIDKDTFKCIECIFKPKAILTIVDEMSEVMETNDYKAQSSISDSISSIARLGRAAACHLCLATQRPSGNVISSDLKNNIQMTTLLGGFGTSESTLCFDEDISDFCKPEIKGRGFVKTGNEIYEYQSFWISEPNYILKDKDFESKDIVNNLYTELNNDSTSENNIESNIQTSENENSFENSFKNEVFKTPEEIKEFKRKKRSEARKRRIEEKEKAKDKEIEEAIEKENSGDSSFEEKEREKPVWDAEEFFDYLSEDSENNNNANTEEDKNFEESSKTNLNESKTDNYDEDYKTTSNNTDDFNLDLENLFKESNENKDEFNYEKNEPEKTKEEEKGEYVSDRNDFRIHDSEKESSGKKRVIKINKLNINSSSKSSNEEEKKTKVIKFNIKKSSDN